MAAKSADEARAQQAEKERIAAAAKAKSDAAKAKNLEDLVARFGPKGSLKIGTDQYGNLQVYELNQDGSRTPLYFWIEQDGVNFRILNQSDLINRTKSLYKNNLESLRKSLYERGYMSEKEYMTKSEAAFNGAILQSGQEHSVEQAQKYTVEGVTTFKPYNTWLSGKGVYTSGTGADTEKISTPRAEADQDIDKFFQDMIGRAATPTEKQDYFNKLSAAEKNAYKKRTVSGSVGTTVDTLLTSDDYFRIQTEVLKPAVKGTKLEVLTTQGGKIAQGISSLKEYAAAYGIRYSTQNALDAVLGGLIPGKETDLENQKNSIKQQSKAFYKNLSDLIDGGVKVSDIANQFAYYKGQLLETPDNVYDAFDPEIQAALQNAGKDGVMSITDFQNLIRTSPTTKPKWLKTKQAREEASNYATSILRMFGLMA